MRDKEADLEVSLWDEMEINEVLVQSSMSKDEHPFDHGDLTNRIKRTLYYAPLKRPDMDTLSFSATKSAVSCFRHVAPMPMKKLGHRYASQVARDACISPCALLLGLIYIDRLRHKNPNYLTNISSSDLFLVSMMVASKYLYDEGCEDEVFNDEWAVSGEMDVAKVNKLEREFLTALDWRLYVHPQEFSLMLNIAETDIALSNGCGRGWLTYSDLRSLLDCNSVYKQLTQTAGILSKVTCMCMIMYGSLVCLAAVTSTALVAVSRTSHQKETPFGPYPYGHVAEQEERNYTSPEPLAVLPDSDSQSLADAFPGFSEESSVLAIRRLIRRRSNLHRKIPSQYSPHRDIKARSDHDDSPDTFTKYDISNQQSFERTLHTNKFNDMPPTAKSLCTVLETMLFMAHVPAFWQRSLSERCDSCGKPDTELEQRSRVCYRSKVIKQRLPANCSVRLDNLHEFKILPRHEHPVLPAKKNSAPGIFNPSIPPIIMPTSDPTDLKGSPIILH